MLFAMILVCSLANTPDIGDCSRTNAVDVVWVPEAFSNPVTCLMHGQAYLAGTALGRTLTDDERVKVVCVHRKEAAVREDAALAALQKPVR